jgi:dynein heavy chain
VIYDLYRDQQASINEWSGMTWANIDINSIEKGSDEFYKRLNRMSKDYEELTAFHKLKEFVAGFKESVPLIKMMKSDAIKERHWKKLMKETGLNIEIDLKTITLQQIFDLQLQNHQDKVEEIINEASQESKIEESLSTVE